MSQISALVAANNLPQLAIPLIEASSQPRGSSASQLQAPQSTIQDTVTISSEAAALQSSN